MKKPHLDNTIRLRGIYFIDDEDPEFKENMKNARKKLEKQWLPSCLAKFLRTRGIMGVVRPIKSKQNLRVLGGWLIFKTTYGRVIAESSRRPYCGTNSLQHHNLVLKFYSFASSHEISRSKGSSRRICSKDEGRKNSIRFTDGLMSFEECCKASKI